MGGVVHKEKRNTNFDDEPFVGTKSYPKREESMLISANTAIWIVLGILVTMFVIGILTYVKVKDDDDDDSFTVIIDDPLSERREWKSFGKDESGARAIKRTSLSRDNVDTLEKKTTFLHNTAIEGQSVRGVAGGVTYRNNIGAYTSEDGYFSLFYLDQRKVFFTRNLTDILFVETGDVYTARNMTGNGIGVNATIHSRNAPAWGMLLDGTPVVSIGDQGTFNTATNSSETHIYLFDGRNGDVLGISTVSDDPFHIATMDQLIIEDHLIYGLSSNEVVAAGQVSGFTCCTSVGEFGALDLSDITTWKWGPEVTVDATAQAAGISGASPWQSSPTYDEKTGDIYFGTGQAYSMETSVALTQCLAQFSGRYCLENIVSGTAYINSVLKVNAFTGEVRASQNLDGPQVFNTDALSSPANANGNFPYTSNYGDTDMIGAGILVHHKKTDTPAIFFYQKNNVAALYSRKDLSIIWVELVGGDYISSLVGSWGYTFSEKDNTIYVAVPNSLHRAYEDEHGTTRCDGYLAALDLDYGKTKETLVSPDSRSGTECADQKLYIDPLVASVPFTTAPPTEGYSAMPTTPDVVTSYYTDRNPISSGSGHGFYASPSYGNGVVYSADSSGNVFLSRSDNINHILNTLTCGDDTTAYKGGTTIGENQIFISCGVERFPPFQAVNGGVVIYAKPE